MCRRTGRFRKRVSRVRWRPVRRFDDSDDDERELDLAIAAGGGRGEG